VLRIFIALKNPSTSAGTETANGKHVRNYTTDEDKRRGYFGQQGVDRRLILI
jgi:hypothetical protein